MKIVVCSVPKSGTYLISNFLSELGFGNSNLHLNDEEYSDYTTAKNLNDARKTPEMFKIEKPFVEAIGTLEDDTFAVGHFSKFNKIYLNGFKTIFIYRDLEKCCASFAFWTLKTTRWMNSEPNRNWRKNIEKDSFVSDFLETHGDSLNSLFKKTVDWIDEPSVLKVKFEDLIGENGREIQIIEYSKIASYLELELDEMELESKIANTLNKESLTKINCNKKYDFYLNEKFAKIFKDKGFVELNAKLGYDHKSSSIKNFFNSFFKIKKLSFYDKYWIQNKKSGNSWNYGITVVDNLINNYDFKTVLDAGCGSCDVVRYLLHKGYQAKGIELSESVLKQYGKDLLSKNIVMNGSLDKMPFENNSFDVIFSSEVLEHIPEENIYDVVKEFYRISKKHIFLTISLRPSSNFNKYHVTLRDRNWWEDIFNKAGFVKDDSLIKKLQKQKFGASNKEVLEIGPTKTHIHEMDWFIKQATIDFNGELEPWYFIFKKK